MVEAMASGRPVLAYKAGGAEEIVEPGKTGEFFEAQSWEDLADAVVKFNPDNYDSKEVRERALRFDKNNFKQNIKNYVEDKYNTFNNN